MKNTLAVLLALVMVLCFAACGGKKETAPAGSDAVEASQQEQQAGSEENAPQDTDLSGFLATKTGRYYHRFADGKMYMKYELTSDGQLYTIVSATNGEKTYSESAVDGQASGCTIMDGENMYVIDPTTKTIIKMALQKSAQSIAGEIIEEADVDLSTLKTGTREVDGKTYDTEEMVTEGETVVMCFDGDDLAYIISTVEGEEYVIKVLESSDQVDESLFELPSDYNMIEM